MKNIRKLKHLYIKIYTISDKIHIKILLDKLEFIKHTKTPINKNIPALKK